MTVRFAAAFALAAAAIATSAWTHHSQAMFDMSKCETVSGTVRTLEFQYPHSWLWVVVPNKKGTDIWGFEFAAPGNLVATDPRWNHSVVAKGDRVSVQFSPIKDGRNAGSLAALTLPDGSLLTVGTPACGGKYSRAASVLRELEQERRKSP